MQKFLMTPMAIITRFLLGHNRDVIPELEKYP